MRSRGLSLGKHGGVFSVVNAMSRVSQRAREAGKRGTEREGDNKVRRIEGRTAPAPERSILYLVPSLAALAATRGQQQQRMDTTTTTAAVSLAGLQDCLRANLAAALTHRTVAPVVALEANSKTTSDNKKSKKLDHDSADGDDAFDTAALLSSGRTRDTATAAVEEEEEACTVALRSQADRHAQRQVLHEALALYNPTLSASVVRRVAAAANPPAALALAAKLRAVLQSVGDARFVDSALPRWRRKLLQVQNGGGGGAMQRAEEAAGIAARLSLASGAASSSSSGGGGRRQQQRLRGFVRHAADLQVNEVLPSGRVVSYTAPTILPDGTPMPPELTASLKDALGGGDGDGILHLHFVLYRERASLAEVFDTLAREAAAETAETAASPGTFHHHHDNKNDNDIDDVSGDVISAAARIAVTVTEADFAVNVALDNTMVSVQTCSLRVVLGVGPTTTSAAQREACRRIARRIAGVNATNSNNVNTNHSSSSPRVAVQLLGWRRFPCSPKHGALCRAQYSMLLRGLQQHGGHLEALALTSAQCVPNFFGPGYFAPSAACPFRHYHAAAAVDAGRFAEAVLISAVIEVWRCVGGGGGGGVDSENHSSISGNWVRAALRELAGDEDRPGVWRELHREIVPDAHRRHATAAKSALLWNVVASSRAQLVASEAAGKEAVLTAAPDVGDFVRHEERRAGRVETTKRRRQSPPSSTSTSPPPPPAVLVKPELLPASSLGRATADVFESGGGGSDAAEESAVPIFSADEATPFSLLDVVAPVDAAGACEELSALARELGFRASPAASRPALSGGAVSTRLPHFRAVFVAASGFPRAASPWVKEFTEPTNAQLSGEEADGEGDEAPGAAEYRLLTDADLQQQQSHAGGGGGGTHRSRGRSRDYAERSRGQQAELWPIGRRGRAIADRLPPGLLASAALSRAGPTPAAAAASLRRVSKCLVMHFTLPAEAYCGSFLREFALIEDCCPSPAAPQRRQRHTVVDPRHPSAADGDEQQQQQPSHPTTPTNSAQWTEGNMMSLPAPRGRRA